MKPEATTNEIIFPDFKYYKLDRDVTEIQDGAMRFKEPVKRFRIMHGDILNAAMTLLKDADGEQKQRWVNAMLWSWYNWMPDYFFQAPASATHKFHPAWADRPDGLALHSLAVCRVAASLSDLLDMSPQTYNLLIFAAWHHDMFKYGELGEYKDGEMTVHEHPVLGGGFFLLSEVQNIMSGFGISKDECQNIADLIATHAGPYRASRFSTLRLPECVGAVNKLLYKSDYIASRKEDAWVQDLLVQIP